jgi:hypothetical protein
MKKLVLFMLFLSSFHIYSQTNFKWDHIGNVDKNKNEIYSDTKMFIADYWKSAKNVLQNDDREGGFILLKGEYPVEMLYQLNNHKWTFSYTIKFMIKENKYRINIEDIYCSDVLVGSDFASSYNSNWPKMPVSDNYPSSGGLKITGVGEKRYIEIMDILRSHMQSIVDNYVIYIEKVSTIDNDW